MGASLLCETVTGATMAALIAARDAATTGDMVELRLDGVADVDVARALAGRRVPAVVTCRAAWEGGRFNGSENERCTLLTRALELGAEYVDVEWQAFREDPGRAGFHDLLRADRTRVIVSVHDFTGVPADLPARVRAMRATGAAMIKVAVTATRLTDTLQLVDIARDGHALVIGMGDAGVPSRLLASRFGSRWAYAGGGAAPGQLPAKRMVDLFRFRDIGPKTAIYGVVGTQATSSISPALHNAAFAAAGIDAAYVPLCAADFDDFLVFANGIGIAGASVTIPFKLDALQAAASADELTRNVGAANTLRRHGGGTPGAWEATNTDMEGFLETLRSVLMVDLSVSKKVVANLPELRGAGKVSPHAGMRVAVLGAGGAARAVVAALVSWSVPVTVHARREEQARRLAEAFGARAAAWPPAPGSWDLLVNCTPLGGALARDESPLPGGPFDGYLVYDLTYGAGSSRLLREARGAGCLTLDGLPMLVVQAERQFEWWAGRRPPPGVMRQAALGATAQGGEGAQTHSPSPQV